MKITGVRKKELFCEVMEEMPGTNKQKTEQKVICIIGKTHVFQELSMLGLFYSKGRQKDVKCKVAWLEQKVKEVVCF